MKIRVRRIQRDLSRRQMMQEIPTATAAIVNPTTTRWRFAIRSTPAPPSGRQGKELPRETDPPAGDENQVPIVENPPLARALYPSAESARKSPPTCIGPWPRSWPISIS